MSDVSNSPAVSASLTQAHDELIFVRERVAAADGAAPRGHASGWSGPAAIAFVLSLEVLHRELDAACELLRSAADLTAAALYELGGSD